MASIAFDVLVRSAKWILGFVVIEANILPLRLIMTIVALRAEVTAVDILKSVACHACPREIFVDLADMAGCTFDVFVSAFEPELCLTVVERLYPFPIRLVMAIVALFTEAAFVRFDLFVAIKTESWRLSKGHFCKVAPLALDIPVGTIERIICKCVTERLPVELNDVGSAPLMV